MKRMRSHSGGFDIVGSLPVEVATKIIYHLDYASFLRIQSVSSKWNALTKNDLLWKHFCEQVIGKPLAEFEMILPHRYTETDGNMPWKAMFMDQASLKINVQQGYCSEMLLQLPRAVEEILMYSYCPDNNFLAFIYYHHEIDRPGYNVCLLDMSSESAKVVLLQQVDIGIRVTKLFVDTEKVIMAGTAGQVMILDLKGNVLLKHDQLFSYINQVKYGSGYEICHLEVSSDYVVFVLRTEIKVVELVIVDLKTYDVINMPLDVQDSPDFDLYAMKLLPQGQMQLVMASCMLQIDLINLRVTHEHIFKGPGLNTSQSIRNSYKTQYGIAFLQGKVLRTVHKKIQVWSPQDNTFSLSYLLPEDPQEFRSKSLRAGSFGSGQVLGIHSKQQVHFYWVKGNSLEYLHSESVRFDQLLFLTNGLFLFTNTNGQHVMLDFNPENDS